MTNDEEKNVSRRAEASRMADEYQVEFSGLSEHEAFKILQVVSKNVGTYGHRLLKNGNFVLGGTPKKLDESELPPTRVSDVPLNS